MKESVAPGPALAGPVEQDALLKNNHSPEVIRLLGRNHRFAGELGLENQVAAVRISVHAMDGENVVPGHELSHGAADVEDLKVHGLAIRGRPWLRSSRWERPERGRRRLPRR